MSEETTPVVVKPGFKTTEWYALLGTILASVLAVTTNAIPADSIWAIILGAASAVVAYIWNRAKVKSGG